MIIILKTKWLSSMRTVASKLDNNQLRQDREIYGNRRLHDCGGGRRKRCVQVGAAEILSERTKWMGESGLCTESVTEYWRTEKQARGI